MLSQVKLLKVCIKYLNLDSLRLKYSVAVGEIVRFRDSSKSSTTLHDPNTIFLHPSQSEWLVRLFKVVNET